MLIKLFLCSPRSISHARALSVRRRCHLLLIRLGVNLIWRRMNLSHGLLAHHRRSESHLFRWCTPILSLFLCFTLSQAALSYFHASICKNVWMSNESGPSETNYPFVFVFASALGFHVMLSFVFVFASALGFHVMLSFVFVSYEGLDGRGCTHTWCLCLCKWFGKW